MFYVSIYDRRFKIRFFSITITNKEGYINEVIIIQIVQTIRRTNYGCIYAKFSATIGDQWIYIQVVMLVHVIVCRNFCIYRLLVPIKSLTFFSLGETPSFAGLISTFILFYLQWVNIAQSQFEIPIQKDRTIAILRAKWSLEKTDRMCHFLANWSPSLDILIWFRYSETVSYRLPFRLPEFDEQDFHAPKRMQKEFLESAHRTEQTANNLFDRYIKFVQKICRLHIGSSSWV